MIKRKQVKPESLWRAIKRCEGKYSFYGYSNGWVDIDDIYFTTQVRLSPIVWKRICHTLKISIFPNKIGQAKISKYLSKLKKADWDMIQMECQLEKLGS